MEEGRKIEEKQEKEIADLKNEIKYLNTLLDLSLDAAQISLDTNRKLIYELKKRRCETTQG